MALIKKPQQSRSLATQEKLLNALEALLKERFFEQISIRDIGERAGVSSGTIYRRFKNKEALLPVLYERFDDRLCRWAETIWSGDNVERQDTVQNVINVVVEEHIKFYGENAAMMRTLYLFIRLNGDTSLPNLENRRKSVYGEMLAPLLALITQMGGQITELKVRFFIQILISAINEKMLFNDFRPSNLIQLQTDEFQEQLTQMLCHYLVDSKTLS